MCQRVLVLSAVWRDGYWQIAIVSDMPSSICAGRFLAEITKQVFADLQASKYQVRLYAALLLLSLQHEHLEIFCRKSRRNFCTDFMLF
jgi:hypothetical protein